MPEVTFVGGPLDGDTHTIRSTTAVLAADEAAQLVWKYVPAPDSDGRWAVSFDGNANSETGSRPFDEQLLVNSVDAGMDVLPAYADEPSQEEIDAEVVITDGE